MNLVPEKGVEPSRSCDHRILSPARLPPKQALDVILAASAVTV